MPKKLVRGSPMYLPYRIEVGSVPGITGSNDSRVPSWMTAKMVARLETATTSGRPVLLRVDFDEGHGLGSSRPQTRAPDARHLELCSVAIGRSRISACFNDDALTGSQAGLFSTDAIGKQRWRLQLQQYGDLNNADPMLGPVQNNGGGAQCTNF